MAVHTHIYAPKWGKGGCVLQREEWLRARQNVHINISVEQSSRFRVYTRPGVNQNGIYIAESHYATRSQPDACILYIMRASGAILLQRENARKSA